MKTTSPAGDLREATILIVDDTPANCRLLRDTLEPHGVEVLVAGDGPTGVTIAEESKPDVILLDIILPGIDGLETCRRLKSNEATQPIPVIFITARDEPRAKLEGFRVGGVDYITKPFQTEEVLARVNTHLRNSRLAKALAEKNAALEATNDRLRREMAKRERAEAGWEQADQQLSRIARLDAERWDAEAMIGGSPAMASVLAEVRKVQGVPDTSVLIIGESGTGKELIARAIHYGGPRAKAPFLPVNCSAVPAELAESLFFGHLKGAFSGAARDEKGHFENAHGGTLFLDEIGDMSLALQAKLLRVLETGAILPLGAKEEKSVDVRVLAATNSDLQARLAESRFRRDLYFRLARFVMTVPPLRERRDDIGLLAEHFLRQLTGEMGMPTTTLSERAQAALRDYDYPGNVRELRNLLERALIECGDGEIRPHHLHFVFAELNPDHAHNESQPPHADRIPHPSADSEEETILDYARKQGGINNAQCRRLLGVGMHRAWYLLHKLHGTGTLTQDSSGRWATYRPSPDSDSSASVGD